MKKYSKQKGFTLIELLLYMGILSILLMVLVGLFGGIVNVNLESQATSAVSSDGRYMLERMTYDVRQATSISTPAVGSTSATVQFTKADGKTYTYMLTAGQNGQENLVLSDGTNTDQLNSYGTSVSNLAFTRLATTGTTGNTTITVAFTLTSTIRDQKGYQQENFQTTIGTRW